MRFQEDIMMFKMKFVSYSQFTNYTFGFIPHFKLEIKLVAYEYEETETKFLWRFQRRKFESESEFQI